MGRRPSLAKDFRAPKQRASRRPHPNDELRNLARTGRAPIGPTIYVGGRRHFDAVRASFLILLGSVLVLGGIAAAPFLAPHDEIVVTNLVAETFVTPEALRKLDVTFATKPAAKVSSLQVRIDGAPATVVVENERLRWVPPELAEGRHRLTLRSGSRLLWRGPTRRSFTIEVDSVAPTVLLDPTKDVVAMDAKLPVTGRVEPHATVLVNGKKAEVAKNGHFSYLFATPPIGMISVEAKDRAGNASTAISRSLMEHPVFQGIHVPAIVWTDPERKAALFEQIAAKRINAVVIDVKDDNGTVPYRTQVARARDVGAATDLFDLNTVVAELHAQGLRVVGRLVGFADPAYVRAAGAAGRLDELVLAPNGKPYETLDTAFANPVSPVVQAYILDLAAEVAAAGVDDILLDDLRRPVGDEKRIVYPGLVAPTTISEVIVRFAQAAALRLEGSGARLGLTVKGISATRSSQTAQNVPRLARTVDYIVPEIFPTDFRTGSYGFADPGAHPGEVVTAALADFSKRVEGTDAVVVPWLQAYTEPGRISYTPVLIRAQIDAAKAAGTSGFLLWNARGRYEPNVFVGTAATVMVTGRSVAAPAAGLTGGAPTVATVPLPASSTTP